MQLRPFNILTHILTGLISILLFLVFTKPGNVASEYILNDLVFSKVTKPLESKVSALQEQLNQYKIQNEKLSQQIETIENNSHQTTTQEPESLFSDYNPGEDDPNAQPAPIEVVEEDSTPPADSQTKLMESLQLADAKLNKLSQNQAVILENIKKEQKNPVLNHQGNQHHCDSCGQETILFKKQQKAKKIDYNQVHKTYKKCIESLNDKWKRLCTTPAQERIIRQDKDHNTVSKGSYTKKEEITTIEVENEPAFCSINKMNYSKMCNN